MIQLHFYPGNASLTPHIVLRELGIPFELVAVDRANNAHKSAAYLQLNPNGLIPVLVDGDLVLYETAAICLHLVDSHPQSRLGPVLGSAQRAHFYKWLAWLSNTLQVKLSAYFYPERWVDVRDAAAAAQVKWHAQNRVGDLLAQIDQQLSRHGGPWLLGDDYSVVDVYAFMLCRWTRGFSGDAALPARDWLHIEPFLARVLARPAVQAAFAAEGLAPGY